MLDTVFAKKKIKVVFCFFTLSLLLFLCCLICACISPVKNGEAILTINLSGNSRSALPWPPTEYPGMLDEIEYKIMILRNKDIISIEAKGGDTIRVTVAAGLWNVTIEAYYQGKHYATGSNSVDVKAGRNNTITIQMNQVHWYTVTFDPDNGESTFSFDVITGGTIDKPDNPTKTDHYFVDWYTDSDFAAPYDFNTPVTANITLYAKWETNYYSVGVTFITGQDGGYGMVAITGGQATGNIFGDTITVTATPNPGFGFIKWVSGNDINSAIVSPDPAYTFAIAENTTLYAVFNGNGTAGYPFLVYDADTLEKVGRGDDNLDSYYNNWTLTNCYYKQIQDIDMTGHNWTPIGSADEEFTGVFDGSNHTITGLTISAPDADYQGMFGRVGAASALAEVKNVNLVNVNINASGYVGGVTGWLVDGGVIENCSVSGSVTGNNNAGGVVGENDGGVVKDSSFTGYVDADTYVGGIAGVNGGMIENCYLAGAGRVNGYQIIGGVTGENKTGGTVRYSYATGSVGNGVGYTGGIAGLNNGDVQNCYVTGNVTGQAIYYGGIVGDNSGTVQNCYATGEVRSSNQYSAGGVVGHHTSGLVENCVALNRSVTIYTNSSNTIGRIVANPSAGTMTNNYARSDMDIRYDTTPTGSGGTPYNPTGDPNDKDGGDITATEWGDVNWWKDTVFFTDPWWNGKLPPLVE